MANKNIGAVEEITAMQASDTVLVETGGSLKRVSPATLNGVLGQQSLIESSSYGIEFDTAVSSPACTRIGNATMHRTLPVQSAMRGCLLGDDGTVQKYLPSGSWASEKRDGTAGQVMVEIPEHWRKCETDGTKRRVLIAETALPGFTRVPKMYVSAYEAAADRTNNKLCSVVNAAAQFRGGNNDADKDGTSASFLGKPATSLTRTQFRTYARARKAGSTEWNLYTYDCHKALFWLFAVEYATLDSQAAFNAEPTAEGYRQGGLGAGVTMLVGAKWNAFNGYYPVIPCGYTDELGNGTGVKEYTMPSEYSADGVKVSVPRYRGIENPFGHVWKIVDGLNASFDKNDGILRSHTCQDPAKFSDTGHDGYGYVGDMARTQGYVQQIIFGAGGEIVPSVVGGASTQFFCDYFSLFRNLDSDQSYDVLGAAVGSNCDQGGKGGMCSQLLLSVLAVDPGNGTRLCFIPAAM